MAKYVLLANWTDQGARNAKDTVTRGRAVQELFASLGVNAREFFWTMGQYDAVLIIDAPDDETVMKAVVAVAAQGNLRTTTLRALSEQEMEHVLSELQWRCDVTMPCALFRFGAMPYQLWIDDFVLWADGLGAAQRQHIAFQADHTGMGLPHPVRKWPKVSQNIDLYR